MLLMPFSMPFSASFTIRAITKIVGTVKSKIIIMTPLTKRRFAMANIERPKHATNRGAHAKMNLGETMSETTRVMKQRNDQTEGLQPF